jgi:hypothetical protein
MKTSIMFLFSFYLVASCYAHINDSTGAKMDTTWKDIIDEVDLFYVDNALDVVKATNATLESLLNFIDQMEGSSYTDSAGKLPAGSYNAVMADSISRMFDGERMPLEASELMQYNKVKIIQCNWAGWGFNEYDFFPCSIRSRNGRLYYEKLAGSQIKSGYLYRRNAYSFVFLGAPSADATYESPGRIGGVLYKVGPDTIYLIFAGQYEYEIHCLKR